jgi:hypothetical protein
MWLILVNHEPTLESSHSKPPPSQFPHVSYSAAPYIFARHSESSNDIFKMFV